MGEVYKARDTRLDRTVAVKVLPEHVASDPVLKERFEREARALAALSHPHICPVYDVGLQDGIDFLVMEYLEGETLAERLTRGALLLDRALQVAIQIADALDKAHRGGVVHRDLKPGNVMLTKTGAKLLDFGLAKQAPAAVGTYGLSAAPTVSSPLGAARGGPLTGFPRFSGRSEAPGFGHRGSLRTARLSSVRAQRRPAGAGSGSEYTDGLRRSLPAGEADRPGRDACR